MKNLWRARLKEKPVELTNRYRMHPAETNFRAVIGKKSLQKNRP